MLLRAAFLLGLISPDAFAGLGATLDPLARLYRDFAWEAVSDTPTGEPGFLSLSDAVWSRYFSPRLVRLLRNDRQCVARMRAFCKLDFSPIWASQNPGAARLKVVLGDSPASVDVFFDYRGNGQRIGTKFLLVRSGPRWLIDEIHYADRQELRKILEERERAMQWAV